MTGHLHSQALQNALCRTWYAVMVLIRSAVDFRSNLRAGARLIRYWNEKAIARAMHMATCVDGWKEKSNCSEPSLYHESFSPSLTRDLPALKAGESLKVGTLAYATSVKLERPNVDVS